MAQFLRIATESAPDLRERGIPDDVSAVVERAMARDPKDRPSAAALGEDIQRLQRRHGFARRRNGAAARPGGGPSRTTRGGARAVTGSAIFHWS